MAPLNYISIMINSKKFYLLLYHRLTTGRQYGCTWTRADVHVLFAIITGCSGNGVWKIHQINLLFFNRLHFILDYPQQLSYLEETTVGRFHILFTCHKNKTEFYRVTSNLHTAMLVIIMVYYAWYHNTQSKRRSINTLFKQLKP